MTFCFRDDYFFIGLVFKKENRRLPFLHGLQGWKRMYSQLT